MKSDENLTGNLPFSGQWIVGNTPASKIPSHGTNLFGVTYALDFMAVDKKGRTSRKISLKTIFGTENPKDFYSFGQPILSPVCGKIIKIHDDEPDQKVRRSLFAGIPYLMKRAKRLKERIENITGNYIVIQPKDSHLYICSVHIKKHSFIVREGETVLAGEQLAECGNSGNSTQPHIHIQAMDSMDFIHTKGIPLYFDQFFESNTQRKETTLRKKSFPNKHKVISTMSN